MDFVDQIFYCYPPFSKPKYMDKDDVKVGYTRVDHT